MKSAAWESFPGFRWVAVGGSCDREENPIADEKARANAETVAAEEDSAATPFEDLLAGCLSRIERDGPSALESVCAEFPDQAKRLRAGVRMLADSGLLEGEATASVSVPKVLGDYRILDLIGEGGMGVVYLARQESLSREVALKLIRVDQMHLSSVRARFQREVEAVARLKHPSIVPIYGVGEEGGIPYYAMERIDGSSVDRILRSFDGVAPERIGPTELAKAISFETTGSAVHPRMESWRVFCISVARDIAVALEHAHERGVLHRDVKPSNVLVDTAARPFLVDFGLASTTGSPGLTRTGTRLGSVPYMAPEQLRGEKVDERTDLYGLGACLYEMLTLVAPFGVDGGEALVGRILTDDPVPPRRRNRALTSDDDAVCLRMLEKSPGHRYQSAGEVAADLENLLARRPISARRPSWWIRSIRLSQRRPALTAAVILGVLLIVVTPSTVAIMQFRSAGEMSAANKKLTVQFERAEKNLDDAGMAIAKLRQFGSELLRGVPRQSAARGETLQLASGLYEGLLKQRPVDPGMRFEMAIIRASLGAIYLEVGRTEEGESLYSDAESEFRRLMNVPEYTARSLHHVASIRSGVAQRSFNRGEHVYGLGQMRAGDDLFRESVAIDETRSEVWVDWSAAAVILAQSLAAVGDLEEAAEYAGLAVSRAERAHALSDGDGPSVEAGATAHSICGIVAIHRGSIDDGVVELHAAERTLRSILDAGAPNFNAHRTYVSVANNLGTALLMSERSEGAIEVLTRAISEGEALRSAFPALGNIQSEMASAGINLSLSYAAVGDSAAARSALDDSIGMHRAILESRPEDVETRHSMAVALTNLSVMEMERSHEIAGALATEAMGLLLGLSSVRGGHPQYPRHVIAAAEAGVRALLAGGQVGEAEVLLRSVVDVEGADAGSCSDLARLWMELLEARPNTTDELGFQEGCLSACRDALAQAIDLGFDGFYELIETPLFIPLRASSHYAGLAELAGPVE